VREALRVSAQNFIDSFHDQVSVFVTSSRDNRKSVPQREDRIQGEFECTFNVLLGKHGTRPVVATWVICDVTRSGDAPGNDPTSMLRLNSSITRVSFPDARPEEALCTTIHVCGLLITTSPAVCIGAWC